MPLEQAHRSRDRRRSGKQARRLLAELNEACRRFVRERVFPGLRDQVEQMLGSPGNSKAWSLAVGEDAQSLVFGYPTVIAESPTSYIRQSMRLEVGARAEHWPSQT